MTYAVVDARSFRFIIGGYRGAYGYLMCREYVQTHQDQFLTIVAREDGKSEYRYVGD